MSDTTNMSDANIDIKQLIAKADDAANELVSAINEAIRVHFLHIRIRATFAQSRATREALPTANDAHVQASTALIEALKARDHQGNLDQSSAALSGKTAMDPDTLARLTKTDRVHHQLLSARVLARWSLDNYYRIANAHLDLGIVEGCYPTEVAVARIRCEQAEEIAKMAKDAWEKEMGEALLAVDQPDNCPPSAPLGQQVCSPAAPIERKPEANNNVARPESRHAPRPEPPGPQPSGQGDRDNDEPARPASPSGSLAGRKRTRDQADDSSADAPVPQRRRLPAREQAAPPYGRRKVGTWFPMRDRRCTDDTWCISMPVPRGTTCHNLGVRWNQETACLEVNWRPRPDDRAEDNNHSIIPFPYLGYPGEESWVVDPRSAVSLRISRGALRIEAKKVAPGEVSEDDAARGVRTSWVGRRGVFSYAYPYRPKGNGDEVEEQIALAA